MDNDRINQLEKLYAGVEVQIDAIEKSGIFEDQHLQDLRVQKTQLTEEIAALKAEQ